MLLDIACCSQLRLSRRRKRAFYILFPPPSLYISLLESVSSVQSVCIAYDELYVSKQLLLVCALDRAYASIVASLRQYITVVSFVFSLLTKSQFRHTTNSPWFLQLFGASYTSAPTNMGDPGLYLATYRKKLLMNGIIGRLSDHQLLSHEARD